MNLNKSHWATDENHVSLTVPFAKVDKENRIVSGFATLDNIDTSDDVVQSDASGRAFTRFRGNIREMHQPIAAGRLVNFKEDSFYDSETKKFYNGIYVDVYVSKGAQSTWEKVLDGTLSGFSIGGSITEQSSEFVKDADGGKGKTVRFIKEYDLIELSLVDNPANQLANVFSIVKNADGMFVKGMIAETEVVNVFWCPTDEIAKNSADESESCNNCGRTMEQIGWFERGEDAVAKTANTVAAFLRQGGTETNRGEGGVTMSDIEKGAESADSVEDQRPAPQQQKQDAYEANASDEDGVVTSDDVSSEDSAEGTEEVPAEESDATSKEEKVEETDSEPDFEKMFDDLKNSVKDSIANTVAAVEKKVSDATAEFDKKVSEFEKSLGEFSDKLEGIKTERDDVAKRLDALENSTAIKKSGDDNDSEPVVKTRKGDLWSGTFWQ